MLRTPGYRPATGGIGPSGSRRRECGGAAVVVQIAAGAGYHTAVMKWNVFIGNICDGCWQQLEGGFVQRVVIMACKINRINSIRT